MISSSLHPITQSVTGPNKHPPFGLGCVPTVVAYSQHFGSENRPPKELNQRNRFGTVKQFAQAYSSITTEAALRHLIWQAESYARNPTANLKSNGFLPVIYRPGGRRKILLNWEAFERWLTMGQAGREA